VPAVDEVWASPIREDRDFWGNVQAQHVLSAVGSDEVFFDDIKKLGDLMQAEDRPDAMIHLVVCPGEIHVQCILDVAVSIEDGIMLNKVLVWLQSL
jgi:hypothetical protein